MNWLSDHFLLMFSGGAAVFVLAIFLLRRLFANHADDSDAMKAAVRASQIESGSSSQVKHEPLKWA